MLSKSMLSSSDSDLEPDFSSRSNLDVEPFT